MRDDGEGVFEQFLDQLMAISGYPRTDRLDHLRVGILHKNGRRSISNVRQIQGYLADRLNIPVDLINDPGTLSLPEQMKLMSNYGLIITPSGSMSFVCTFLPRGAAFVHIDFWDLLQSRSETMEGIIWRHFSNLVDVRYHVQKNEVIPNATLSRLDRIRENSREKKDLGDRSEFELWRNYGDIVVDAERMWTAVRTGLQQVASNWDIGGAWEREAWAHNIEG